MRAIGFKVIIIIVLPESIHPFPALLLRGLHASLTQYSHTQPHLYLGRSEEGIPPAASALERGITLVMKFEQHFVSCLFATKGALMISLEFLHFHRNKALDKAYH